MWVPDASVEPILTTLTPSHLQTSHKAKINVLDGQISHSQKHPKWFSCRGESGWQDVQVHSPSRDNRRCEGVEVQEGCRVPGGG